MKEIARENLYYRDLFLEENDINLSNSIDFSLDTIKSLLGKYNGTCDFAEQLYCCEGFGQRCWTELYFIGNWGLNQDRINADLLRIIEGFGDSIMGRGRVFLAEKERTTDLFIFARDLRGDRDIVVEFGEAEC